MHPGPWCSSNTTCLPGALEGGPAAPLRQGSRLGHCRRKLRLLAPPGSCKPRRKGPAPPPAPCRQWKPPHRGRCCPGSCLLSAQQTQGSGLGLPKALGRPVGQGGSSHEACFLRKVSRRVTGFRTIPRSQDQPLPRPPLFWEAPLASDAQCAAVKSDSVPEGSADM